MDNTNNGEIIIVDPLDQEEESDYTYTHNFKKPFSWEGKTYETLHFDFSKLNMRDFLTVGSELTRLGIPAPVPSLSGEYQARVALRACEEKIDMTLLYAMPLLEGNAILRRTKDFLLLSER
jgi:hypothetical protein